MRKLIIASLSIVLLGAGCFSKTTISPQPVDETSPEPVEGGHVVETQGPPPAIVLTAAGETIVGAEGSYCYGPSCVDKIGPIQLVEVFGLDFTVVDRSEMRFSSEGDIFAMSVSVLDENGDSFHEAELQADASGSFAYEAPETLPPGDYYVTVFGLFEAGGDVSYVFPVTFE